jgi:uncharacterized protein (PEP-CTERM system associated)
MVPATDSNQRSFTFGIDYAFRPNVILFGDLGYLNNEFTGTVRTDDIFTAGLGGTYILNRYLSATAGYAYQNRDSTIAGQNYTANIFRFTLGFQV